MTDTVSFQVPRRIESARLVLRMANEPDWHAMHTYYSDPDCMRFTIGRTLTEGESWRMTAALAGHWLLRGYGPYVLEEKATGSVVGTAGLWYPGDWPEPEIKWGLVRSHWGRGLASEAARAVLHMAAAACPQLSLISLIHGDNIASIRVALAVGAAHERDMDFRDARFGIYRHATAVAVPART